MWKVLLSVALGLSGVQGQSAWIKREPLQKSQIRIQSPARYEKRIIGQNLKTGEFRYYDPKPRVLPLDSRSGKYGLRWIGYDGKVKTIIYQRPDAIEVVVSASVSRDSGGRYVYTYNIINLASSAQHISIFAVQNFATDVSPMKIRDLYIGGITRNKKEFKDGSWIGFSMLTPNITPGRSIEVTLVSVAPPGVVECRAAGVLGMKGVGEEMPHELENALPGYEIWPRGYIIGPHDWLKTAPTNDKISYLKKLVPRMRELGWLTASKSLWYEQNLGDKDLSLILQRVEDDFRKGEITSEVRDLIKLNLQ